MTSVPGPHLTPDDLDAWLAGILAPTSGTVRLDGPGAAVLRGAEVSG